MALNFPDYPSNGQTWTTGAGVIYRYDGSKWTSLGQTSNVSGPTGYTGSKGYTGSASTISGPSGPTGGVGPQGPQGAIGTFGYTGSAGFSGSKGFSGSAGFTGSQGDTGFVGSRGSPGNLGDRGYTGSAGEQGLPGLQGPTGDQGISVTLVGSTSTSIGLPPIGNPGDGWIVTDTGNLWFWNTVSGSWNDIGPIVGPQGDLGYVGSRGSQGNPGLMGPVGYTGSEGPKGYDGSKGDTGSTGYVGSQGDVGYTGSAGAGYAGSQGIPGSQGSTGYTGSKGDQGPAGGSANTANFVFTNNQIAVSNDGNINLATNSKTWTIGADGTLTLPRSSNQLYTTTNALIKSTASIQISVGSNTGSNWIFGIDNSTVFPNGASILDISGLGSGRSTFFGDPNGLALGTGFGYDFAVNSIDGAHIFSNNYEWHFKTDGNVIVPGNILSSAINTATTNGIAIATGVDTNFVYIPGTTVADNAGSGDTTPIIVSGKNGVNINAGADAYHNRPGKDWIFNTEGFIALPGGNVIDTGVPNKFIMETGGETDFEIFTIGTGTNTNTWSFGRDGILTAPGHILPDSNLTYDLGSTSSQWRSIYVGTGTVYIGGVALGVNQDNYVTVDGNPIITVNTTGNLTIQGDTNVVLGAVIISDTAPAATTPGSQWYNTLDGRTYVAYNGAWIDASPTVVPTPETYLGNIAIDGDTLNINGGTLTIDDTGTLLVNGSEVSGSGYGATLTASATDPGTSTGTLWFNTVEGRTYLKYNDQWVDVNPTVVPLPSTYLDEITIDGSTINMNGSTLAINTAGVLLVNGSEVTGGNDTGLITFDDVKIMGNGDEGQSGAIKLVPNNALYGGGQWVNIYPTGAFDYPHVHMAAGTGGELYIGNDQQYVKTGINGNIDISSFDGTNTNVWSFGTDGTLTLPSSLQIVDLVSISGGMFTGTVLLQQGSGILQVASTGTASVLGWADNAFTPNALTTLALNSTGAELTTGNISSGTHVWYFGTDGSTTFPDDTILGTGQDPNVYIETSTTATTSTWTFGTDGVLTLPADTPIIKGSGTGTDVTVVATTGSNTSTWVFGANSSLTLPNGSSIGSGAYDSGIELTTVRGTLLFGNSPDIGAPSHYHIMRDSFTADVDLFFGDDYNYVLQPSAGGVVIGSTSRPSPGTQHNWTFGTDGGLTFPNSGGVQTEAWNDTNFMAAMLGYDGEIITNTATVGVGGLVVNGPVTFNGPFTYQTTATTAVTGNTGTFYGDVYGVGALYAGVAGYSPLPATVFQSSANVNGYIQNNFQNLNNGVQASTEWVATANNGDDSNHYLDMGIAGGAWDGSQSNSVGTAASANDSWIYAQGSTSTSAGGNLILGTIKNGKSVKILTGSTGSSSIVATFNGRGVNATTTNTGALQVVGGIGVSGNVYAGSIYSGDGYFRGPAGYGQLQLTSGGELTVPSNLQINGGLIKGPGGSTHIGLLSGTGGAVKFYGTATVAATTTATSTTTGALTVAGGVGIAGNAYVGGYVVQQALPAFRVYGPGGQISSVSTVSGASLVVDFNQGNYLNTSTGVFTAPVAGIYQVNLVARTYTNAGVSSQAVIEKTSGASTSIVVMIEWAANTTMNHAGASSVIKLAVGDTLRFRVLLGSISFDGNDNWSVAFLG